MTNIKDILNSAISILKSIKIDYNSPIGPRTTALVAEVSRLVPLLKNEQPYIAECLNQSISNISFNGLINAYSFGDIRTALKILDNIYSNTNDNESNRHGKKIFISHSSKDRDIVNGFIKEILKIGCGFKDSDIFCTLDPTVIRTGDDFREKIVENMKSCDFILLFISENYMKSEICHNEMGAAWALESKRILPFVLPDFTFSQMGFLNVVKQGASITDKRKLDEFYNEICEYYGISSDWPSFNKAKEDFTGIINTL